MELIGIAVRDTNASRHWNADPSLYTTDAESLIDAADVVIELTGGIEPARTRILRALKAGKSVVSGNKALLAKHGVELQAALMSPALSSLTRLLLRVLSRFCAPCVTPWLVTV